MNVQFSVRGRTFNVRTDDDGVLLTRVAEQLDQKIAEQAVVARKLDEPSLAIISALDLLHESAIEKAALSEKLLALERKLDSALAMVEALLPPEETTEES